MGRPRRRIRIANRARGGLWWRIPLALLVWLPLAAPQVASWIVVRTYREYAASLPEVPDLARFERTAPRTTRIVAADGTILAELPFTEGEAAGHRTWVAYDDLPPTLIAAVLAAEDARFFEHEGVDLRAVVRAAWMNWRAGRTVEGASTITQQVARNLLPDEIGRERTARRKVREMILARRIERRWSKREIFETYVNLVFLGSGAYGVAAGARSHFDRDLHELDPSQHALLAGLIQAPSRLDPWKDPDAAKRRRDEVLDRMLRAGLLDAEAHAAAIATPLGLRAPRDPYGTIAPWMTELARSSTQTLLPDDFARGGLTIETTVEPALVQEAERRARDGAARVGRRDGPPPQVGVYAFDHRTGYVEAIVGGWDWTASKFDRATQACRQPGSAFKPIVYAAAIERDAITPGTALRDAPVTEYDEDRNVFWKPQAAGHSFRGVALAQDALAASLNAPAIDVLDRVGTTPVIELARRLGLTTAIDPVRPLVLGSSCAIPAELARAYGVIAARGRAVTPTVVRRIVAPSGTAILDRTSPWDPSLDPSRRLDRIVGDLAWTEPILDEETAFLMTAMLADVVRAGTGRDARAIGRPAAGKTGTTNRNTDAWFVGFTGRVAAAVWVGHDDPATPLGPREDGRRAALPIWVSIVKLVEADRPEIELPGEPPAGVEIARVDRETGLLAVPGAGGSLDLWFRRGTAPTETVEAVRHVPREIDRISRDF